MAQVINTTFRLKRGTAARWIEVNPILALGEPGFVSDEYRLKVGDGVTPWINLPYIGENDGGGVIINADTKEDFPVIGNINIIYKAQLERKLYQWNPETFEYETLLGSDIDEDDDVIVLYGGSAFDNVEVY